MKDVYNKLALIDAGHVLDAATGRGEFINIIKTSFKSYTQIIGIDNSEKSVDYAQKLFPENDIEIYRMNLEALNFEDASFDTVTMANSLHHLENPDQVFFELLRVLKPGGRMILAEMYKDGAQSEAQQTHILIHHWIASIDRLTGVFHQDTFSKDAIISLTKKLKLKKTQLFDYYIPVDNPKTNRSCETLIRNCNDTLKRLESIPDSTALAEKGKTLIQRINDIGCAPASRIMLIGFK